TSLFGSPHHLRHASHHHDHHHLYPSPLSLPLTLFPSHIAQITPLCGSPHHLRHASQHHDSAASTSGTVSPTLFPSAPTPSPSPLPIVLLQIPLSADLLTTSAMPLSIMIQPFALQDPADTPVHVRELGEAGGFYVK
ncbi:unnamed protein product, partial [Closterium sp. NIES-54]